MPRDLKSIVDVEIVAKELERAKKPSGGFDSTWFDELVASLSVHAPLDEATSERDRLGLCQEAISTVAGSGAITKARLLAELDRRSRRFLAQPQLPFVLVASLSCRYFPKLTRQVFDGWTMTFSDGPPKGFDRSYVPEHVWAEYGEQHLRLAHVRVSGRARTINEALDAGLERLDFVRGIWNFVLNRRVWSQFGPRENVPINQVRIGPIHTLHLPNGKPAGEVWWYELFPVKDSFSVDLSGKWQGMAEQVAAIRAAIKETTLGRELRRIMVRYCRALDGVDHEVTVLQLWSLLETLTATGGDRYDATIQRVRFLYEDEPLIWYVLEMLRDRRNGTAHSGTGGVDARKAALQLHRFVAELLTFSMQLSGKFENLEELGQFLSMARDAAKLKSEIAVRQTALKFRRDRIHGRKLVRKQARPRV